MKQKRKKGKGWKIIIVCGITQASLVLLCLLIWFIDGCKNNSWNFSYPDFIWMADENNAILFAPAGNGRILEKNEWIKSDYYDILSDNEPTIIQLIDVSEGVQKVKGRGIADWGASKDGSVHCFLVKNGEDVVLYIAFNEPKNRRLHTGSSFQFNRMYGKEMVLLTRVTKIENMNLLDTSALTDAHSMFYSLFYLTEIDLSCMDTSSVTDMSVMFYNCRSLRELDLSRFDTSSVTAMYSMFVCCESLKELDLSRFDTSSVIAMDYMFAGCESLKELDLSRFDTSSVTSMDMMIAGCESLKKLDLSRFDTSSVTSMEGMFAFCESLKELNLSGFDTSEVTDMEYMFKKCESLADIDISSFNTSNVEIMGEMFQDCKSLKTLDISRFDTSGAESMEYMFSGCESLTELDLSYFNTSNVKNMTDMFNDCRALTRLDISGFDTSECRDRMFSFVNCDSLTEVKFGKKLHPTETMFPGADEARKQKLGNDLDGRWYSVESPGVSYLPEEMIDAPAGTYRALPVY